MYNEINKTQNKNGKITKIILILTIILLIMISLFLTYKILTKNKNRTRTIMIYMVGADLESKSGLASNDLDSINYDEMDNKNINVVLIAGGSKKWNNTYIDEDETSIYELTSTGFEKIKTQNVQNMGDDKVFSSFLNYVHDNYKTNEYDLIFWNHGGAIYGSQMDELSKDILSLNEMKKGLENSPFKEKKLELIIFRTCLNGTLEVANILDDYSKYLVASEEITYGTAFTSVLNFINKIKTNDNSYDIGYKFIESYKEHIKTLKSKYSKNSNIYSTYSIVNLSKVKNLTNSLNDFISEINIEKNYNEISKIRSNLYQYAYTQSDHSEYDMVDLYNLIENLQEYNPNKAKIVLKNIEDTIEYNWATNSNSRGLSIYFPYNANDKVKKMFLNIYKDFDKLDNYYSFINKFYNIQIGNNKTYSFNDNNISISNNKNNINADFTLELTDEQVKGFSKAKYIVFRDNKDGYYLPIYIGGKATLNKNKLVANIKDKQLKVMDKSDKDFNGYILTLIETENSDEYIKYNTNVILQNFSDFNNYKMDNAQMNLILNKNSNNILVNNVTLINNETLKPNTVSVDINKYNKIGFGSSKYKIFDSKGNFTVNWSSNGIYEGYEIDVKNIDFKLQEFDNNYDYYCIFLIYDTNNKTYYSKLIKMG